MKTPSSRIFAGTLLAFSVLTISLAANPSEAPDQAKADLEVHEWGTFTVLEGSDGKVIEWYQAPDQLVDLPPFVRQSIRFGGKSRAIQPGGRMDIVRMETPVLYFYPREQMDVTVRASFPMGRITEVFPPAVLTANPAETVWHGTLLPPDSPERSKVPSATGPAGRHYAAAREVPDAWLFRNKQRDPRVAITPPAVPKSDAIEPVDHFIFYRGAGNQGSFELTAVQGEGADTFTLTNRHRAPIPRLIALRVNDGQTSWLALDQLATFEVAEGKALNQPTFTFPAPAGPAIEVAADLRTAMIASLHSEGLTADEAAAMVATWDDLWFTEPGTRILAILPQTFADDMVPLTITPTPKKIDRVFVARVEIITREKELQLISLLNPPTGSQDPALAAEQLTALNLGRYSAGGMERAATIVNSQMRDRFARLTQAAEEQQKLQTRRD